MISASYSKFIDRIEITPLTMESKSDLFWHVSVVNQFGITCGGLSNLREHAIRIGISEYIERFEFSRLLNTSISSQFLLDKFPSTCGFAAGFNSLKTKKRSIAEAVERWCWSKWVDEGLYIN